MNYCYLNRIYTDADGASLYYELVHSNSLYENPQVSIVDLEKLLEIAENPPKDVIVDFHVKDDVLMCNTSEIDRVQFSSAILLNETIPVFTKPKTVTLYDILELGVKNDFSIIDPSLINEDDYKGNGVVGFRNIKFSQSSMSIYVRMVVGNEMYNLHLAQVQNGVVKVEPFYFLVPDSFEGNILECSYVKRMYVNNKQYSLYRCDANMLFIPLVAVAPPLINKACCNSIRLKSVIKILQTYKSILYELGGKTSEKLNWVGESSNPFAPAILFECSNKVISNPEKFVKDVIEICKRCETFENVRQCILESDYSGTLKFAAVNLSLIIKCSENFTEQIDNLNVMIKEFQQQLFYCDCFAHKIRMSAFLSRRNLVSALKPYFTGSEQLGVTFVRKKEV